MTDDTNDDINDLAAKAQELARSDEVVRIPVKLLFAFVNQGECNAAQANLTHLCIGLADEFVPHPLAPVGVCALCDGVRVLRGVLAQAGSPEPAVEIPAKESTLQD